MAASPRRSVRFGHARLSCPVWLYPAQWGLVSDTVATSRLAGDMIKGAFDASRERGVVLFVGESEGDAELERTSLQAIHDRQVDGIILAAMYTRTIKVPGGLGGGRAVLLDALAEQPCPPPSALPDEVAHGGVGFVRDGDTIVLDMETRSLDLDVPEEELAKRRESWQAPVPRHRTGVLAKYAKLVGSAARGAICS
ncbi:dihydroxy-acid dehydratase [Kibdelosporangium lantanae]|uniref:Dihydroxy-acid dehydratase n=1 Tax=Kibdelosporangium lantanae TaxID=1497396 RepID=A0ABW3M6T8_9PSEU